MNVARIIEILSQAELVELSDVPALSRDAGDDKFLATCVAANADYLVTEDQDLLVLGEHEGTKIVDAVTFAQILDRE
jgi:putative PIN family toxin of toxin-antitoxin system